MKRLLTLVALAACSLAANAQFCIQSVTDGTAGFSLKYVSLTDTSTLVYGTYTADFPEGKTSLVNVPDDISVVSCGATFKMKECRGLMVSDTGCFVCNLFETPGQKLNFVMEFEKFGFDAPFDVVSAGDSEVEFKFHGVTVNTGETKEVDAERFLSATKVISWGKITNEKGTFYTYEKDSLIVSAMLRDDGAYAVAQISIENNTDHGVLVNTSNITFRNIDGKGESKDLKILSKAQYDKIVASGNWAMADVKSGGTAVSILGSAAGIVGVFLPTGVGVGLSATSAAMHGASVNMASKKLAKMEEAGETMSSDDYLVTKALPSKGDKAEGVLLAKKHYGQKNIVLTITADEYPFTFWCGSFPSDAAARY